MNRTECKKMVHEKAEYHQPTITSIISQIADLAYCNGYNHVLDAADKVLDAKTYSKLTKELAKMDRKEE